MERFIFFILLLLLWKSLFEIFIYIVIDNSKLKEFIRKYDYEFNYIIKILLFIQKWKNPLLLLLLYLDKFLFKIVRNFIYNLKIIYKIDLTNNQLFNMFHIYYFIINVTLCPFKLLLGFIYTIINRMIEMPFSFFLIIRIIGFLLSVLIVSNLLNIIYIKYGFLQLFIFIYLFLIFINCMIKYINRDFKYLKVLYINSFINTDYLIDLRNHTTFCGLLIITISWYQYSLIEKEYIDVTSANFKTGLEEGFNKYWEYYKRNTWLSTTNVWKEIKNRPSLYLNLLAWINLSPITKLYAPNAITNIVYIKCKIKFY